MSLYAPKSRGVLRTCGGFAASVTVEVAEGAIAMVKMCRGSLSDKESIWAAGAAGIEYIQAWALKERHRHLELR